MGKIYLLGTGIYSSLHLTTETIQALKVCHEVYVLHDDPIVLEELKRLNPNIIDCIRFYTSKDVVERYVIYDEIANEITLKAKNNNLTIGFVLHGHPLFLVSASEKILLNAERDGLSTVVLPAISSFDSLLADLRIDFGYAVQMYDVNFFFYNDVIVNTIAPLILFQVTTFQNSKLIREEPEISILEPLISKLLKIYPGDHEITLIHSASHIFERKHIIKSTLSEFLNLNNTELWMRPTLYIPEIA